MQSSSYFQPHIHIHTYWHTCTCIHTQCTHAAILYPAPIGLCVLRGQRPNRSRRVLCQPLKRQQEVSEYLFMPGVVKSVASYLSLLYDLAYLYTWGLYYLRVASRKAGLFWGSITQQDLEPCRLEEHSLPHQPGKLERPL